MSRPSPASSASAHTLARTEVWLTFIMYNRWSSGPWKPRTSMACVFLGGGVAVVVVEGGGGEHEGAMQLNPPMWRAKGSGCGRRTHATRNAGCFGTSPLACCRGVACLASPLPPPPPQLAYLRDVLAALEEVAEEAHRQPAQHPQAAHGALGAPVHAAGREAQAQVAHLQRHPASGQRGRGRARAEGGKDLRTRHMGCAGLGMLFSSSPPPPVTRTHKKSGKAS